LALVERRVRLPPLGLCLVAEDGLARKEAYAAAGLAARDALTVHRNLGQQ
jgi:hypothetical protein